ncbi:M91 family zinc metallopeptidase [Nocardia sp. NPDC058666]|uniref:M91 family zinc metallopeptidase n=1 Tax=Nocardia sp. NPDC058666 TaxID=3346587 RepID=UPI00366732B5
MALTWNDVKNWNGDRLEAMARAYSQRDTSIRFLESIVRRSADIEGWTGTASEGARAKITSTATELDRLASQVEPLKSLVLNTITTMEGLRSSTLGIETLAGTEGFTIAADGKLGDAWAEAGRTDDLTDDERARRARIAAQVEVDVAKVVTDANALDEANAAALNSAAGNVVAPAPGNQPPAVDRSDGGVVIETGPGNDNVEVTEDPNTNIATVIVNGKPIEPALTPEQSKSITIKSDAGDDTITVARGTKVGVKIEGGDGKDTILGGAGNDTISGGNGDDTILASDGENIIEGGDGDDSLVGGTGRDYINGSKGRDQLSGGDGDDVIYGGDGDDRISGNRGNDYLEGSKGNDVVGGDDGNDILSGGIGDDTLSGGAGDDKVYGGHGKDTVGDGLGGADTFYVQTAEDVVAAPGAGGSNNVIDICLTNIDPDKIKVEGSDEFKERVNADLEFYRSSPVGQATLEGLSNTEHTVTIREGESSSANGDWSRATIDPSGKPNVGSDSTITYDPQSVAFGGPYANEPYNNTPPSVTLLHEAAHAYDITHGTIRWNDKNPMVYQGEDSVDANPHYKVQEGERVAVGLPIDHDHNPQTPEQLVPDSEHPTKITENEFREELGLSPREHYAPPEGPR